MERVLFRGTVARGLEEGKASVDRENNTIKGYAVITLGEAKGHGVLIDETTLNQVVSLGTKSNLGIKSRFGHPNMSSTALGTFLGRSKNFRQDGDVVRADLFIDQSAFHTPNGDLGSYVLDLAENDPDAFGASIAFSGERQEQLEEDGKTPKKDQKTGKELLPFARIKNLMASDVVDEPAANTGFFDNTSVQLSAEMTEVFNTFLATPDAVEKVVSFLERFQANKEIIEDNSEKNTEDSKMDLQELTMEMFKQQRSDLFQQIFQDGEESGKTRAVKIVEEAVDMFGEGDDGAMICKLLQSEKTANESIIQLKNIKLAQLRECVIESPGASVDVDESLGLYSDIYEKEYSTNEKLRSEFSTLESYRAFRKAEQAGKIKIISK